MTKEPETKSHRSDYDINVGMIALSVAAIVLILVAIFCIKTYAEQKQIIYDSMRVEGEMMEAFYSESLDHTWYVVNLLAEQIKANPHDIKSVKNILNDYISSADVRDIFGWTEFVWFDHVKHRRMSSNAISHDKKSFPMPNEEMAFSRQYSEKISYWLNSDEDTIYAVVGVIDNKTGKYLGSLAVNFDLATLTKHINERKKHDYTNFALIGEGFKVITQSRPSMEDAGLDNGWVVERHLVKIISNIGFTDPNNKVVSFLDTISGVNYYVKKVADQPFVLLVNIDHEEIQNDIFNKIVVKFVETSIFASCFLLIIILIYRREAWLRERAEIASEIANRATDAKSDYLAFTAHEIRSPLGFILTGSELMQKKMLGNIDEAYMEYVDGIHKNAELILDFITDILDEEHILEGSFKIVSSAQNVQEIIDNAVAINLARFTNKKTIIKVEIEENLPKLICDARRILQVVNNLISNAIKYSNEGTIVRVIAKIKHRQLYIEVVDRGVGMTSSEVQVALTKYGTVRKKNFDFIESYGLGLPIVKKLLEAHDAQLLIDSKVDVGTKVSIIFPQDKLIYTDF